MLFVRLKPKSILHLVVSTVLDSTDDQEVRGVDGDHAVQVHGDRKGLLH
jgi:hypothetical protein